MLEKQVGATLDGRRDCFRSGANATLTSSTVCSRMTDEICLHYQPFGLMGQLSPSFLLPRQTASTFQECHHSFIATGNRSASDNALPHGRAAFGCLSQTPHANVEHDGR